MHSLSILETVRQQVRRVLCEIDTLEALEFPYGHSRDALIEVRKLFLEYATDLSGLTDQDDKETVELHCAAAFENVQGLLPILGFILRSTNVRNAFEVWGPLWRLAKALLGKDTRLLLSSEWEYSPYTFIGYDQLPGYVLIGLPATESSNPFLLPLAGHELGHSVWHDLGLKDYFLPKLQERIIQEIKNRWADYSAIFVGYTQEDIEIGNLGSQTWEPAASWAIRQAEECFCDFFGLRIFGESFLHSAVYLLAPHRKGPRAYDYPNGLDRSSGLIDASATYGLTVPSNFSALFADLDEPPAEWEEIAMLLSLSDCARRALCCDLIKKANEISTKAKVPQSDRTMIDTCIRDYRFMLPVEDIGCLADILNAGWEALLTKDFFPNSQHEAEKANHLTQLMLKSIEILEIQHRRTRKP